MQLPLVRQQVHTAVQKRRAVARQRQRRCHSQQVACEREKEIDARPSMGLTMQWRTSIFAGAPHYNWLVLRNERTDN